MFQAYTHSRSVSRNIKERKEMREREKNEDDINNVTVSRRSYYPNNPPDAIVMAECAMASLSAHCSASRPHFVFYFGVVDEACIGQRPARRSTF